MKWFSFVFAGTALALGSLLSSCEQEQATAPLDSSDAPGLAPGTRGETLKKPAAIAVFVTGLNCPRGLKFGPDGYLYVAEAGYGGTSFTAPEGNTVSPPIGPYTGGLTGRISRVSPQGVRSTVAEYLPSCECSPAMGSQCSGVADVEFRGSALYALLGGAGTSHGMLGIPNSVIRVGGGNDWGVVADLSRYLRSHPVANPNPRDFEPDGTWYSMVNVNGELFAVEPNHGELDGINLDNGQVYRVADISASIGHRLPTAVAYRDGYFYVGIRNMVPFRQGGADIYKISRTGAIADWATGFTSIVGMAFDKRGRLYVLENTTGHQAPTPGTGAIVRVNLGGWREVVASGLSLPSAMTIGPDGALYVSNKAFGHHTPGTGEILRIEVSDDR